MKNPFRIRSLQHGTSVVLVLTALLCRPLHTPGAETLATQAPPDINRPYKQKKVDVEEWLKRLEREGREVYDQRKRIVSVLKLRPGMDVADVGAGTGLFTMLFAKAVGPKGRVYAVDIAPDFLAYIRERARHEGLTNIITVLGTDRSTRLPRHSVDLAFVCDTYHHFEQPKAMLASIATALKPGGSLVLVEFKRIPGKSRQWILDHVRGGEELFTAEIEAAGFRKVESFDFLKDNYILRFVKKSD